MGLIFTYILLLIAGLWAVFMAMLLVYGYYLGRNKTPYVSLPDVAIPQVIAALGVSHGDIVYDLGCGDGRVLRAVQAKVPGAQCIGVENNLLLVLLARWRTRMRGKSGDQKPIKLIWGNVLKQDVSKASRIIMYLGPSLIRSLEPKLDQQLTPGTQLVSIQFPLARPAMTAIELKGSASYAQRAYVYEY